MLTFRHLIATGTGVAIALSNIQPGASQTAPSPPAGSPAGAPPPVGKDFQPAQSAPSPPPSPQTLPQIDKRPAGGSGSQTQRQAVPPAPAPNPSPKPADKLQETPAPSYLNPSPNPLQFPTQPQEVQIRGTQPITLKQALELARRNNRDFQVAQLQVEQARAALREAVAAEYPSLNLTSDLTRTDSAQARLANVNTPAGLQQRDTVSRSLNGQLELSYDVYTSGRRSATIRAAEKQVRLNQLELERTDEKLRLDVSNAYYDVQQADEQVRINESSVRNAQQSLKDAESLERAGVGTRFDVLRAQVQLSNEQQNLTQARSDQRIKRRQLAQLLSLSQSVDLSAADPVEVAGFWNLSLEESIVQAFKNRSELEQQLVQREVSDAQRQAALASTGPQVSVFGRYNLVNDLNDNVGFAGGYTLGTQLRWSLYDGGAARARASQEETSKEIAETRFASQRNQVRFEVEQAYYGLRANFDNIQTASVEVQQSTEALRLARLRFQAGVGTQSDVISAENDLSRSEGNRVQAILGYNRALASMQRAVSNIAAGQLTVAP
jgi:outer membrane protein TolC